MKQTANRWHDDIFVFSPQTFVIIGKKDEALAVEENGLILSRYLDIPVTTLRLNYLVYINSFSPAAATI